MGYIQLQYLATCYFVNSSSYVYGGEGHTSESGTGHTIRHWSFVLIVNWARRQRGRLTTRTYIWEVRFSSHESKVDLGWVIHLAWCSSFRRMGKDLHVTTVIPPCSVFCCRLTRMYEFASHIYHLLEDYFWLCRGILILRQMLTEKTSWCDIRFIIPSTGWSHAITSLVWMLSFTCISRHERPSVIIIMYI
jgi:hypothetical protein